MIIQHQLELNLTDIHGDDPSGLVTEFLRSARDSGEDLTRFLTEKNYKMVADMKERTMGMINHFFVEGLKLSKLTFNMDANL